MGYNTTCLNGITGFEPVRQGVKVLCLTTWLYPNNNVRQLETNIFE